MKDINKNIIALGFVSFFTDMASSIINILLPIYVVYVLHEGVDKLGIIIAVATFISYAIRVLFGYLSDKYNIVKPFVVVGYVLSAFTKPMFAFADTFISIAFLQGVERMGKAVRSASKDMIISAYSTANKHGKTFGFHKMMDIAGELVGALIVFIIFLIFIQNEILIKDIFLWTLVPGMIATTIVIFFVQDVPKVEKKTNIVLNREDYRLFPLLFIYFGFLFFIVNQQFLIVLAKQNGFTLSDIPLFIILFTLVQTITSYYGGILSDKKGNFKIVFIAFIFGIFSMLSVKINLLLSFGFLGLFTVLSLNALRSYISINAKSKGFVFGVFYAGMAIFSALGSLLIGYLWEHYGFEVVYLFSIFGMTTLLIFSLIIIINSNFR
ncbi:MFS transporter [Sulfurimonas sp. C5]|uniref:MFS transporter n=1 Tax=Sulfurimonas sp. C5 TaxID=3036947 RepID=UPI002453EC78|nr:MFS transporter [Sulfurimonas sp. C5]MDH4944586.1 MFS transporter [Sulfurimonas sp. C5]